MGNKMEWLAEWLWGVTCNPLARLERDAVRGILVTGPLRYRREGLYTYELESAALADLRRQCRNSGTPEELLRARPVHYLR